MKNLTEKQTAIMLLYDKGLSIDVIALELTLSEAAINRQLKMVGRKVRRGTVTLPLLPLEIVVSTECSNTKCTGAFT